MRQNIAAEKSYAFAVKIVQLCRKNSDLHRESVLTRQLLRSGTSIGANVEEAIGGQSRRDFASKIGIAYKEARETHYWLRLLQDAGIIEEETARRYLEDCRELKRILAATLLTINGTRSR